MTEEIHDPERIKEVEEAAANGAFAELEELDWKADRRKQMEAEIQKIKTHPNLSKEQKAKILENLQDALEHLEDEDEIV